MAVTSAKKQPTPEKPSEKEARLQKELYELKSKLKRGGSAGQPLEKKHRMISVTGISGVGKDELVREAVQADKRIRNEVHIINFGDMLFDELRKKTPKLSRKSEISEFPESEIKETVSYLVNKIYEQPPVVLIAQVIYIQQDGFFFNFHNERALNPILYICVTSDPVAIIDRVNSRPSIKPENKLNLNSVEEISLRQELCLSMTNVVAKKIGTPVIRITNDPDDRRESMDILRTSIRGLLLDH